MLKCIEATFILHDQLDNKILGLEQTYKEVPWYVVQTRELLYEEVR